MIENVPTFEDFQKHGLNFLNLAWDSIFELLRDYNLAEDYDNITDDEQIKDYWEAAQRPLSIAHALAQQGAELILKSIVAEQSPFLLITGFPNRINKSMPANYADFRTVDAQDLIKMCNTIFPARIPKSFIEKFNEFRSQRNSLFHSVDKTLKFSIENTVEYILEIVYLVKANKWIDIRKEYFYKTPSTAAYGDDCLINQILEEVNIIIKILPPSVLKKFFPFNKRQRSYRCPNCFSLCDSDFKEDVKDIKTAQLSPNKSTSKNLYCFVCNKNIEIERRTCKSADCNGNVIFNDIYGCVCLTCGYDPDEV